jgi:GxxExxY protein
MRSLVEPPPEIDSLARIAVDAAFHIHQDIGPGLLESVYESIIAASLRRVGLKVDRQKPIDIEYDGLKVREAFRIDLLLNDVLVLELKSSEQMHPLYSKQVLTYIRLMRLPLGLLLNFGLPTMREGVRRVINNHRLLAPSRLGVSHSSIP